MPTIDEIIVIGKRPKSKNDIPDRGVRFGRDIFERDLDRMDAEEDARDEAERQAVLGPIAQPPRSSMTLPKTSPVATAPKIKFIDPFIPKPKFLPVLYNPATIPEIIVTAKRLPRVRSFLSRASLPTMIAEVGGQLLKATLREAGRQAFEELGEKVTRTIPARPDTKVKTIPKPSVSPELIPEIIVTAKRRPRPTQLAERVSVDMFSNWFNTEMLRSTLASNATNVGISTDVSLATPTLPQVQTSTRTATVTDILTGTQTMSQVLARTRTHTLTLPATSTQVRRSTLLGIGTGTAAAILTGTNVATGIATQSQLAQITRVGQATKYCQPCPRPKKKRRTKCYRQLVKQGRYASRDKINKWAEINCETGQTIKELI